MFQSPMYKNYYQGIKMIYLLVLNMVLSMKYGDGDLLVRFNYYTPNHF